MRLGFEGAGPSKGGSMSSLNSRRGLKRSSKGLIVGAFALLLAGVALGVPASAQAAQEQGAESIWDALTGGDPYLNMRARIEIANTTGATQSEAYTLRTRLGYGTKAFHGFSAYGDFENVATPKTSTYFDATEAPTGQTTIADPTVTEVNQAYLKIAREDMLGSTVIGGRQRIIFDDHRFVGNVGWRQNEQTYDAASLKTSLNIDGLQAYYGYLWEVRRIFGNQGTKPNFDSDSHIINVSFDGFKPVKATAFAYLLNFAGAAAANSTATYGFRLTGSQDINDDLSLGYQGSYAYQTDFRNNAASYGAHYVMLDGKLGLKKAGALGVGYEMLGSDGGAAQFRTPLATAHKFNGWADVFLDNGGPAGLRDFYVYIAPKLPCKVSAKLVYHHFRDDDKNNALGNELDVILKRPINEHFSVLTKVAWFEATSNSPRKDTVRFWMEATLKF